VIIKDYDSLLTAMCRCVCIRQLTKKVSEMKKGDHCTNGKTMPYPFEVLQKQQFLDFYLFGRWLEPSWIHCKNQAGFFIFRAKIH